MSLSYLGVGGDGTLSTTVYPVELTFKLKGTWMLMVSK